MGKIIIEYGTIRSYARLIDFYKNESNIVKFKDEKECFHPERFPNTGKVFFKKWIDFIS